MEGLGIQIARALVEQIADQIADAGFVGRVLAAPPPKAYSIAISGTVASCTNQASMPPGETRCWIFVAACDGVAAIGIKAKPAATIRASAAHGLERKPGRAATRETGEIMFEVSGMDHERFSSRFGAVSLIR